MALLEGLSARLVTVSARGWAALAFIGATSAAGYFLWLRALRYADASRVTLFLALSPLTALLYDALVLDATIPVRLWIALGLIAASLLLMVHRKPS